MFQHNLMQLRKESGDENQTTLEKLLKDVCDFFSKREVERYFHVDPSIETITQLHQTNIIITQVL